MASIEQVEERAGLENIVAFADQVDAATRDVMVAWEFFQYGSHSGAPTEATQPPRSNDKLEAARYTLREAVAMLSQTAQDIRSRA